MKQTMREPIQIDQGLQASLQIGILLSEPET